MTLYLDRERIAAADRANAEMRTQQVVDDVTAQRQQAEAPPQPSYALPSLSSLLSTGQSVVQSAIGMMPRIGSAMPEPQQQTAPAAPQWTLPSLESLGISPPEPPPTPSGTPAAMPQAPGLVPATITTGPKPGQTLQPGESVGSVDLGGPIVEGDPQGFFQSARAYADAVEREYGIPAAFTLAVAANETGYGQRRYMAGDNNYHGIQDTTGTGTPYRDWRPGPNGEKIYYEARQAGFASPLEGFRGFGRFLTENPRYQPAIQRYRQTGDAAQFARDVHAAGYAEDPEWSSKVTSIMGGIPVSTGVGSVTAPAGVGPQSRIPGPEQSANGTPITAPAAQQGAYAAGSYTPNQINAATSEGLDYETALAVCGPAAAIAFARKNGRNPTMQEAVALAREVGWTVERGMVGPANQQQLLQRMGVASRLTEGEPDWQSVAADVQRGNPVTISTPGHYFVAERYDPESGAFDFGESAAVLKASGGRRWFRPEELPGLGMGAPRATLYIDNPESPTPSIAADARQSLNAGAAAASPQPAPAAASAPPSGGTSTPDGGLWSPDSPAEPQGAYQAATGRSGGTGVMLRGPLSSAPAEVSNDEPYDPRQYDEGQREAAPTSTYNDPTTTGTISTPIPQPEVTYQIADGRSEPPTPQGQWEPVTNLTQPQPVQSADPGGTQWLAEDSQSTPIQPVQTAEQLVRERRIPLPAAAQEPPAPPVEPFRPRGMPEPQERPSFDPLAELERYGEPGRKLAAELRRAYDNPNQPINAWTVYEALQAIPFEVVSRARRELIPDRQARLASGTDPAAPFRPAAEAIGLPLPSPEELNPEGRPASDIAITGGLTAVAPDPLDPAANAVLGTTGRAIGAGVRATGAAGRAIGQAVQPVAEDARRLWREGSETAARLNAEPQRGTMLTGTFGTITGNDPAAAMSGRVVPPEVARSTGVAVRLPDDSTVIRAIEASGGRVTPDGVDLHVTRSQGQDAAGGAATRGGVFYEPVPDGVRSSFAYGRDDRLGVGGSQVIQSAPTTFRSPLIIDAPPGEDGFNSGMAALGISAQRGDVDLRSAVLDDIAQARMAGPPGSPQRTAALRSVVKRHGGDPSLVDELIRLRSDEADESTAAILENILAGNARARGYDGILTVEVRELPDHVLDSYPDVRRARQAINDAEEAVERLEDSDADRWEIQDAKNAVYAAEEQYDEVVYALQERSRIEPRVTELADIREARNPTPDGGYALRPEFQSSAVANASAGSTPPTRGAGALAATNRVLSEPLAGGFGGAVIEQARNPDEDPRTAAARGFAVGAAGFPLATRAISAGVRRAGINTSVGGGARVVPPGVADTLDFPVRIPDDPSVLRAIEAAGGRVDPERGVDLFVTRAQGLDAAGGVATRGGVFYEAIPEGGRSSYVRRSDDPTQVGGSQVIPATPTRFRSPLILSDAPGDARGFNDAMKQMDVRVLNRLGEPRNPTAMAINNAIHEARNAGPEGSPARAEALKDVVRRFGGDPDAIDSLLQIRGADADESAWAIRENILAAHARRNGYDGVVTVEPNAQNFQSQMAAMEAVDQHPDVVAAAAEYRKTADAYRATPTEETARLLRDAKQRLDAEKTRVFEDLRPYKISELVDVREARNPTLPSDPNPARAVAQAEYEQAIQAYSGAVARAAGNLNDSRARTDVRTAYKAMEKARRAVLKQPETLGEPGYTLRDDVPRRASTSGGSGFVPTLSDARNAAQGGVIGAASEMTSDEELTPQERLARVGTGAVLGVAAGRVARGPRVPGQRMGSGMVPNAEPLADAGPVPRSRMNMDDIATRAAEVLGVKPEQVRAWQAETLNEPAYARSVRGSAMQQAANMDEDAALRAIERLEAAQNAVRSVDDVTRMSDIERLEIADAALEAAEATRAFQGSKAASTAEGRATARALAQRRQQIVARQGVVSAERAKQVGQDAAFAANAAKRAAQNGRLTPKDEQLLRTVADKLREAERHGLVDDGVGGKLDAMETQRAASAAPKVPAWGYLVTEAAERRGIDPVAEEASRYGRVFADAQNAAQGGAVGAASEMTSEEELTPQERLARIGAGAVLGVAAGRRMRPSTLGVRQLGSGLQPPDDAARASRRGTRAAAREARAAEVKAVREMADEARTWMQRAREMPNQPELQDEVAARLNAMAQHSERGAKEAERLSQMFDSQQSEDAFRFTSNVERRNADAATAAARQEARQLEQARIRGVVAQIDEVLANPQASGSVERLQNLYADLTEISQQGFTRSSEIRKRLQRNGLLRAGLASRTEDVDGLVQALARVDPNKPEEMRAVLQIISKPRLIDKILEYQYVNMLSSPITQGVNILSNVAQLSGRLLLQNPLEYVYSGGRSTGGIAAFQGAGRGFREALGEAGQIMRTGISSKSMERAAELGDYAHVNREALTEQFGLAGAALHFMSTRPLQAMDALLGNMAYASAAEQYAQRTADRLLKNGAEAVKGMSREQARAHVMSNIWDYPEVIEKAGKISDYTLLKSNDAKGLGYGNRAEAVFRRMAGLGRPSESDGFIGQSAAFLFNQVLPFTNVPLNFAKQGAERTVGVPYNALRAAGAFRRGETERGAELAAKATIGAGAMTAGIAFAWGDNLTGDGPSDDGQRKVWEQTHKRNSFRFGPNSPWISWEGTPWAIPFGMIAGAKENAGEAITRAAKKGQSDTTDLGLSVAGGVGRGAWQGFSSQSFIKSLGQQYELMTGNQTGLGAVAASGAGTVSRFIPAGSMLNFLARVGDDVERDAGKPQSASEVPQNVLDRLSTRVPGARQTIDSRLDIYGEDTPNEQAGLGAVPYYRGYGARAGDPITQRVEAAGVGAITVPDEVPAGGTEGVPIPLTNDEKRAFQQAAGQAWRRQMEKSGIAPEKLTPAAIERFRSNARGAGVAAALQAMSAEERRRRVQAAVKRKAG